MNRYLNYETLLVGFLLLVALASAGDLVTDLANGAAAGHLLQELILLLLALAILAWLIRQLLRGRQQLTRLQTELAEARSHAAASSARLSQARQAFSQAIADQFEQWQLSPSESEIGLMLLKGLSLKEIALLRGTMEKTIRQQASGLYQKAGVNGRHGFSAWFMEDLLSPPQPADESNQGR
ncbi:DNA-binding response regulator [Halioxenophilus sp. WMMB6]|uniref:helix-turn-helix transcriptional regulator n=1 Tax=Halioxenophilus sp. WMMB6 TaxID=3073815 RepID=UPI00295ECF74|nr:DNA-binding response regulator [Halioxenophilus sp. WMMB6]